MSSDPGLFFFPAIPTFFSVVLLNLGLQKTEDRDQNAAKNVDSSEVFFYNTKLSTMNRAQQLTGPVTNEDARGARVSSLVPGLKSLIMLVLADAERYQKNKQIKKTPIATREKTDREIRKKRLYIHTL